MTLPFTFGHSSDAGIVEEVGTDCERSDRRQERGITLDRLRRGRDCLDGDGKNLRQDRIVGVSIDAGVA